MTDHATDLVADADTVAAATDARAAACVNCGAPRHGAFCARCGQPARTRVTLRTYFQRIAHDVFGVDSGLFYTVRRLFRPGRVIREYLGGRTMPFASPVQLLLISAALTSIVSAMLHLFDAGGMRIIQIEFPGMRPEDEATANDIFARWLNAFLVLSVPITAGLTRLFYPRARLNYAEHLVFNSYVFAQSLLLMTAAMVPVLLVLGDSSTARAAAAATWMAVGAVWFLYACLSFFRGHRIWVGVRAAFVLFLAVIVYMPMMALMIATFVYFTRQGG